MTSASGRPGTSERHDDKAKQDFKGNSFGGAMNSNSDGFGSSGRPNDKAQGQAGKNGQSGKTADVGGPDVLLSAVRDTANASMEAVKAQATDLASNVGEEISKVAETQKVRGADQITGMAKAIDSAAAQLAKDSPQLASTVRSLGQKLESLSKAFREKSVSELVNSASDVARNQPVAFMAGSLAAGFAFARFLKSTARGHGVPTPGPMIGTTGQENPVRRPAGVVGGYNPDTGVGRYNNERS